MTITADKAVDTMRERHCLTYARAWRITRVDDQKFFNTDHDAPLDLFDGQRYTPADGFNATAVQRLTGLREQNKEFEGVLSDSAITFDDLRARKFDRAVVNEYLVDFRCAWVGAYRRSTYWIDTINWDGEVWRASVHGISTWLKHKVGGLVGRGCKADLGDGNCKYDLLLGSGPNSQLNQIVGTPTQIRRIFPISTMSGHADADFTEGEVIFRSGSNSGLSFDIKKFTGTGSIVELYLPVPYDIVSGDRVDVIPGCPKTRFACKNTFSNFDNFHGEPTVPGPNRMLKRPRS